MKGLIIKEKWANLILNGDKTIEIRSSNTKHRGKFGIVISGTKKVWGTAELVDAIPLTKELFEVELKDKHKVDLSFNELTDLYPKPYGWVIKNVEKFDEPIPYNQKKGAIIWVNIDWDEE